MKSREFNRERFHVPHVRRSDFIEFLKKFSSSGKNWNLIGIKKKNAKQISNRFPVPYDRRIPVLSSRSCVASCMPCRIFFFYWNTNPIILSKNIFIVRSVPLQVIEDTVNSRDNSASRELDDSDRYSVLSSGPWHATVTMAGISTAGKFSRGKLKTSSPWGRVARGRWGRSGVRGLRRRWVGRSGGGMTKENDANSGF